MQRSWLKLPPVMDRTFADDLRWAAFVLAGGVLAWVISGADDTSLLLWFAVSAAVVIAVLTALRRVPWRRRP
jgi:hypothetical protein